SDLGNGKLDLVVANADDANVLVLIGDGHGSFPVAVPHAVGAKPAAVAIGNLGANEWPDIATADFGSDSVSVRYATGPGTFGEARRYPAGAQPVSIAIADLDGDDQPDIAVAHRGGGVSVLHGDGNEAFVLESEGHLSALAVGDLNGDGCADVVVT